MQIPEMPTMEVYESADNIGKLKNQGVTHSILVIYSWKTCVNTGRQISHYGFEGVFHFGVPTDDLIREFIDWALNHCSLCQRAFPDKSFVGRIIDQDFINDLPENVDVCGETVSFIPSLLTDLFSKPIDFEVEKSCIANMKTKRKFL
jgi:hypothetical protein